MLNRVTHRIGNPFIMPTFKQFLNKIKDKQRKPAKTGFTSIHKKDLKEIDPLLKKQPTPKKPPHLKEDAEHSTVNAFHHAFLEKAAHVPDRTEAGVKTHAERDAEEFAHHHALNAEEEHEYPYGRDTRHITHPLTKYTSSSHMTNRHLIDTHVGSTTPGHYPLTADDTKRAEEHIKALDPKTHHPANALKQPTIVHSGTNEHMSELLHHSKVGERVHFPAYTSTSTHPTVAQSFSNGVTDKHGTVKHVIHFHLPAGYAKGRHVENISRTSGEHEMILHRGQTFKKVGEGHEEHVTHHHFVPDED
jgi:hypothetical protein